MDFIRVYLCMTSDADVALVAADLRLRADAVVVGLWGGPPGVRVVIEPSIRAAMIVNCTPVIEVAATHPAAFIDLRFEVITQPCSGRHARISATDRVSALTGQAGAHVARVWAEHCAVHARARDIQVGGEVLFEIDLLERLWLHLACREGQIDHKLDSGPWRERGRRWRRW